MFFVLLFPFFLQNIKMRLDFVNSTLQNDTLKRIFKEMNKNVFLYLIMYAQELGVYLDVRDDVRMMFG